MTPAEQLLDRLRDHGFRLTPNGNRILIEPASKLTDELRSLILAHKPELLRALAPLSADLERRLRLMAQRWEYSDTEIDDVLDRARRDPAGWTRAVELDEQREVDLRERGHLAPVDA